MNFNKFSDLTLEEYFYMSLVKKRDTKNCYSYFTYNSVFSNNKVYCIQLTIKKKHFFIYALRIEINLVIQEVLRREL